ncbi:serine hydrolase domain-containing protein [Corallococcus llansteffanensis]|uniref:Class A beta-lactamase-related serine hydrolase n=1 Tax=Corallococcus llansteffanensis TaxID=2316731 RepID=A0A3A8PQB6_9BACT|nr:serine hydrolase domain-containing protein [Corallococcus llansteffanensis]RKH58449.1 class A beta-lactamase-related serine hydrolase [Corallococcus llansteffanensis]
MRLPSQSLAWVVVLLWGLFAALPAAAQAPLRGRLDAFVRAELARQKVPGVAVGVVSHGKVVLAKGYGFANLEHQVPVTPDTLFQSGSVGKQFTTMAVMLQVEAGKLSLADKVTKFFPDAPAAWSDITVRHLLTHTSGIADLEGLFDYRKDYTDAELARFAYTFPLDFPVGTRWSYSNTGYVLLGIIVNRVTGTFYGDVLAERVFKPAGMKTARGISEADVIPHRAAGYRQVDGVVKNQEWVSPSLNTTADGSLYFSLKDLLAWDAAVQRRALLTPESWQEILTPGKLQSGASVPYGFGWQIDERGGKPLHHHGGQWQGFTTNFSRYVGDSLSIIVLANADFAQPGRFADGLAALVNPALAEPPLAPIEDREPQVTARLKALLEQARSGTLSPADFAYFKPSSFPERAKRYQQTLASLGPAGPLVLAQRRTVGDDRVYTYLVAFGPRTARFTVALAPDDRVTMLGLRPHGP